jgi:hypothetical protein
LNPDFASRFVFCWWSRADAIDLEVVEEGRLLVDGGEKPVWCFGKISFILG